MIIEKLKSSLTNEGYQDLRYERVKLTSIKVKNHKLQDVSVIEKSGGHARALCGGGYGKLSFNDIEKSNKVLKECLEYSRNIPGNKVLAKVPVVKDNIVLNIEKDPRNVSIEEKIELLLGYCKLASSIEELEIADGRYYEEYFKKYFVNNEGTEIEEETIICGMMFSLTARKGDLTQTVRMTFGGTESFEDMYDKNEVVLFKSKQVVDLLSAEQIKGGTYDVIVDSEVGGLFIHEAFGHLSEADNLLRSDSLREVMKIGTQFASSILNVVDDPSKKGHPGSYIYDDEGVRGSKTYLIKDGALSGRLHSRETAGYTGEEATGHARAKNYEFTPIVRMGNIYIENSTDNVEDIIKSTENGLYVFGSAGGQTSGDSFMFTVQGGYLIENGKITKMVRDISLSGNLFYTLKNIDMIGNNLAINKRGGCGKSSQLLTASGNGAPCVRIKSMAVGGR